NQGALSNAQAQRAIQSQVDPAAFNARAMMQQGTNRTLGNIYGVSPTSASYSAPNAFAVPGISNLPALSQLSQGAQAIAGNIQSANIGNAGGATLNPPTNPGNLPNPSYVPSSYLYQ